MSKRHFGVALAKSSMPAQQESQPPITISYDRVDRPKTLMCVYCGWVGRFCDAGGVYHKNTSQFGYKVGWQYLCPNCDYVVYSECLTAKPPE